MERQDHQDGPDTNRIPISRWGIVKNLIQAIVDAAKTGLDVRNGEETERIMDICVVCPHFIENEGNPRCEACGCFLGGAGKLGKIAFHQFHCPIGKW